MKRILLKRFILKNKSKTRKLKKRLRKLSFLLTKMTILSLASPFFKAIKPQQEQPNQQLLNQARKRNA